MKGQPRVLGAFPRIDGGQSAPGAGQITHTSTRRPGYPQATLDSTRPTLDIPDLELIDASSAERLIQEACGISGATEL